MQEHISFLSIWIQGLQKSFFSFVVRDLILRVAGFSRKTWYEKIPYRLCNAEVRAS